MRLREYFQMSERQACRVLAADRKMIRYTSLRPSETELRERLRELAKERRRFGYRGLLILLQREGEAVGHGRRRRLCLPDAANGLGHLPPQFAIPCHWSPQ